MHTTTRSCLLLASPPSHTPHAQAFHTLYHTDDSVLLGAPTGSGKTISSELTMMRLWEAHPGDKVGVGLMLLVWRAAPVTPLMKSRGPPAVRCDAAYVKRLPMYLYNLLPQCVFVHVHVPTLTYTQRTLKHMPATHTTPQVIYIAPLKALVRERMNDWGRGLCKALGKKLVELTGVNGVQQWVWAEGPRLYLH